MWLWEGIRAGLWSSTAVSDDQDNSDEIVDENTLDSLLLKEEDNEENFEVIQKEGKVTELLEDHGQIDGELYFLRTLQPKISRGPLRIGDCVKYRARRKDENQQWKIIEILWASINDVNWMDGAVSKSNSKLRGAGKYSGDSIKIKNFQEPESKRDDVAECVNQVAKVLNINNNIVQVSMQTQDRLETLSFELNNFKLDFNPWKGDFLCIDIRLNTSSLDDLSDLSIAGISPLRRKSRAKRTHESGG